MMGKRIDNYSIMITSKYFDSIDDFINLEMAVKRFNGNMERFHFNPIPLNDKTRKLFPNLETLHLYDENDQEFNDGRIFKQCIWYEVNYLKYLSDKENDCKCISYTKTNRKLNGEEIPENIRKYGGWLFSRHIDLKTIEIPIRIVGLGSYCFSYCSSLTSISIPLSVTSLNTFCFYSCISLISVAIPYSVSVIGEGCFSNCYSLTSISLPTSITCLNNFSFYNCSSLKSITLPSSIKELGTSCFENCKSLSSIEISSSVTKFGSHCFMGCSQLDDHSICKKYMK